MREHASRVFWRYFLFCLSSIDLYSLRILVLVVILFRVAGTLGILCLPFCRKSSCVLGSLISIVCSFYLVVVF